MIAWRWNMPAATSCILPVENIELLSRYGHEDGRCSTGSAAAPGRPRKARLKERIREMADAADPDRRRARAAHGAGRWTPPDGLYDEFCARFPYEETEDQLRAIDDVLDDIGRGHADGPADLRRRRLRQDRGGAARRLRRGHGRACRSRWSCRPRCWRASTSRPSPSASAGLPVSVAPAVAPRRRPRTPAEPKQGLARRHGRHRHRHPCAAGQGDQVQAISAC